MKAISSLFLFLLTINLVQAETQNIKSSIDAVTVYPSGATIEREAKAQLKSGYNLLRFYGISSSIQAQSIQLESNGDYIVQSVSYKYDYLNPPKDDPKIDFLNDSIQVIERRIKKKITIQSVLNQEHSFILSNANINQIQEDFSRSSEIDKIAEIIRSRLKDVKLKLYDIELALVELYQQKNDYQNQINQLRGNSKQPQGIIEIQLLAEKATQGQFKLSYMTRAASWRPVYDFKFTDINNGVSTKYNAYVKQSTGVDWDDVNINLSTSTPALNNNKPVLHPWYLYFRQPVDYRAKNKAILQTYSYEEDAESLKEVEVKDLASPSRNAADFTQIMESTVSLDFAVELAYRIPSDGKERVINLRNFEIEADYEYYAAPKVELEAFLVAQLVNWQKLRLLPGEANIFMGNTYMGKNYLRPSIESDTISLAFGRDKMVKIERQLLSRKCTKNRLIGKQKHEIEYEIAVKNLHSSSIKIIIEDQVPITKEEDIEIEVLDRGKAERNEKTGLLSWELEIANGKTEKVNFSFEVKHPRNKVVYPLNYM